MIEEALTPGAAQRMTQVERDEIMRQRLGEEVDVASLSKEVCSCPPVEIKVRESSILHTKLISPQFPVLLLPHGTIWRCSDCGDESFLQSPPDELAAALLQARSDFSAPGVGNDVKVLTAKP